MRLNLNNPRVLKTERNLHVKMLDSDPFTVRRWKNATFYEVILLNKILRSHFFLEIISCTRSWNFRWHLLWRPTTERKNIVKLMAISQTIHTVCWEDNYFSNRKFNLFNSLFHSVYLVLPKSCFLLKICLPCVICGTYVMKINAVSWHSVRETSA